MARINSTNSTTNEWPKAFYDDGGGSYGFVPTTKLQSGVVTANLQLGSGGPLISGTTGEIIAGSGINQYVISGGGITLGGFPLASSVALNGRYTWPPQGTITHTSSVTFTDAVEHDLGFVPALQCYIQDFPLLGFGSGAIGNSTWRPWNNATSNEAYQLSPSQTYSDVTHIEAEFHIGPSDVVATTMVYRLQAAVDDTWLYLSETIIGTSTTVEGSPVGGGTDEGITFAFLLSRSDVG